MYAKIKKTWDLFVFIYQSSLWDSDLQRGVVLQSNPAEHVTPTIKQLEGH